MEYNLISYYLATKGLWRKINEIIAGHRERKIHKEKLIVIDPSNAGEGNPMQLVIEDREELIRIAHSLS